MGEELPAGEPYGGLDKERVQIRFGPQKRPLTGTHPDKSQGSGTWEMGGAVQLHGALKESQRKRPKMKGDCDEFRSNNQK